MVERISSSGPLQPPKVGANPKNKKVSVEEPASEVQARQQEDILELSKEAQKVQESQSTERLRQIQSQVNAGFYNRPEIIRETASRILRLVLKRDISIK